MNTAPARSGNPQTPPSPRHDEADGGPPVPAVADGCLAPANLLLSLPELLGHLVGQMEAGNRLDSFLLAAGIDQIAEDHLEGGAELLDKAMGYVAGDRIARTRAARIPGSVAALARLPAPGARSWHETRVVLTTALARLVMAPDAGPPLADALVAAARTLRAGQTALPAAMRAEVLRLPSAFRSFDLDCDDVARMGDEFAVRYPDRRRPICVVGVRTSGAYMAPLVAARLDALGFRAVTAVGMRPGHRPGPRGRRLLATAAASGGLAVVVDDPPTTGLAVNGVVADLRELGIADPSIVLLLPLFGGADDVPAALAGRAGVYLPAEQWSIHRRLSPPALAATLRRVLAGREIVDLEPFPVPAPSWARSHARAGYRVHVVDDGTAVSSFDVLVKGVGLGYFGRHALAVASALGDRGPAVFGVDSGLLVREWVAEQRRIVLGSGRSPTPADGIAEHIAARAGAMPVDHDRSLGLRGRGPVWEAATNLLSQNYGQVWWAGRAVAVEPVVRRLLSVGRPSVVDGNTALGEWFTAVGGGGPLVKVDADERAFCNLDLQCFDPAFDVASAAARAGDAAFAAALRRGYEHRVAAAIPEERWLLYQLVALWDLGRRDRMSPLEVGRRSSGALREYYERLFFTGIQAPARGPICCVDVDGVVETSLLGFAAMTPASAVSLRALARHGYRTVLATGRSVVDVAERCGSYRLAGGVAEYGAAIHGPGRTSEGLLSAPEQEQVDGLRRSAQSQPGVLVDPDHRHSVRAFRVRDRARWGLEPDTVAAVLAGAEGLVALRTVPGDMQTDFVPASVDKGSGLRALLRALGEDPRTPLALAVGDTRTDLPVLAMAERAVAPRHAAADLRDHGVHIASRPYQSGLEEAVAGLLGHRPGRCRTCALPAPSRDARLLLRVLAGHEGSTAQAAWRALRLMVAGRRP